MKQIMLKLFSALLLGSFSSTANAQKTLDVSGFSRDDADLMALITKPVRDKDEKLCALIRVETGLKDLEVRADALGIVQKEEHTGEIWLYVPYGAKSLSFYHEGYYSLLYQYEIPIESGVVYKLRLTIYDTPTTNITSQTQMFILTHNPDDATIIIDDMEVPTENGVFAAMMNKGEHSYHVKATQYEESEGDFVLGDQPVRVNVKLEPLFGTFKIETKPENGFRVSINGQLAGTTPFTSERLEPGDYRVYIEKKKYYSVDTIIRVREGKDLCDTLYMERRPYSRILGGRDLSFGLTGGYLLPFATSSSGGGFTGSPINYSLGDSRENVSYTSQSGFSIGAVLDYRLHNNFYLTAGLNFTQVKYSNKFNERINNLVVMATDQKVYRGDQTNNYKEDYTLSSLEVPILVSFRFVLSELSSIHLNLGPYFSYGLSSKMKLSGSSECDGLIHAKFGNIVNYDQSIGDFHTSYHLDGEFDMYSDKLGFQKTTEAGSGLNLNMKSDYDFDSSPYKKFNYGLKFGVAYELRGFQLGIGYSLQLSNMANEDFWESNRVPIFNNQVGANNMSGYKHRVHALEIKLGYIFRY